MKKPLISQDQRYHFEIWTGASKAFINTDPNISYVENHNGDWDYGLAASDFKMAADVIIQAQTSDPNLSNWTAPICHLIRQTMELQLKSLLEFIKIKEQGNDFKFQFTHNLEKLWISGKTWLVENDYRIEEDLRLKEVERLISNLHGIDPSGDLFRFGTSKQEAFGRLKSVDRVGVRQSELFDEFEMAYTCIGHWSAVVLREVIMKEMDWTEDPYFDANDFPK